MFLNCHSWFSFHYGTLKPEEIIQEAKRCGVEKVVLTDINNTSGVLEFVRRAQEEGLKPVVGVEFRNGDKTQFIGIAKNNDGFEELNCFLSECLRKGSLMGKSSGSRDAIVPERAPEFENVWVIYPMEKEVVQKSKTFLPSLSTLRKREEEIAEIHSSYDQKENHLFKNGRLWLRDNEFIGVRPQDLIRLSFSAYRNYADRCVILWPVTVRNKIDYNVHRLLSSIGHNTLLSMLSDYTIAHPDEIMVSEREVENHYEHFQPLIRNTKRILAESEINFEFGIHRESQNKKSFYGDVATDAEQLKLLTYEGLKYRYGAKHLEMRARADKELEMISRCNFASYFLINWELLKYARNKNYFYVGRGSGANSIVAYALQITDVDPVELDLYFERFINPYRVNPPDFDIDFSWKDRDDITKHIFETHGEEHTALLATYSTYQRKAAARELGKVFGLPKEEIDSIFDYHKKIRVENQFVKWIDKYSDLIQDFPHHLSIHAGGILISEKKITNYTALNHPPKGFPLTQFSMIEAEDVGLYKFDILSQRGLGHIRDTVDIVKKNKDVDIDIHAVAEFKKDEKIKELIRNGKCMGCFYVESPGMRMLLTKLQTDSYLGLVAASSIIRPGVAQSGMMREYILRTRFPEREKDSHPVLVDLMKETFGIMVYQEDVIKVAHYFAGLDLGEADVLRRGMSGKFRSREEFQKVKAKFFDNCRAKKYKEEDTAEVWRQIESFAGYSFSKGHSASYAVESYQSLYLKAYHPLEFMVGVINNFGGFYQTEFYVHEAKMSGANVHAPDINRSDKLTTIIGKDIYLGFGLMSAFEEKNANKIVAERERNGAYKSLQDFMNRVSIEIEQLRLLIRIGAFLFTGRTKKQLLWDIHAKVGHARKTEARKELFEVTNTKYELPELYYHSLDDAFDELEILGFSLSSPFDLLKEKRNLPTLMERRNRITSMDLTSHIGKEIEITGYLVTVKPTRTIKGEQMAFGCFLDEKGDFFDTTHFPKIAKEFPLRGRGCYKIKGKVEEEFGFCNITVTHMEKMETVNMEDLAAA